MKKILTVALMAASVASMSAQKEVVDQASKLSGKIDKIGEARALIQQAEADPVTGKEMRTYFVGGKLEFDAFDEAIKKRALNPQDPAVNTVEMGRQLINGYNMYMKALPLDSLPNEKGQVKPKESKKMVSTINGHHNDYFSYGGELYNNRHYYPEAYQSFYIYGDMPSQPWADKALKAVPDTTLALAFYYAGISAYSGNSLAEAADALAKARKHGVTDSQSYVYEIASWQNIAQRDSTQELAAKNVIQEIATDGYQRFGITKPFFLTNLVNSLAQDEKNDEAINIIANQINKTPNEAFLYGLRAFVLDRKGDEAAALADYRKAAAMDNADAELLVRAARKIYNAGTVAWNDLKTDDAAGRKAVKAEYFEVAKSIAEKAKALDPANSDVDNVMESIDYVLSF